MSDSTAHYSISDEIPAFLTGEPDSEYRSPNMDMRTAWRIIEETSQSLFLTGRAGTGKTTFLKTLRKLSSKRMVVLAPTGIAAINAGGMTIHSFFQLPLSPYIPGIGSAKGQKRYDRFSREKRRIIRTLDLLVIDEISMVRADLLDAVDDSLRRHRDPSLPFGGVQLLLIGDLQQLAPVVKADEWELLRSHYTTPFFFSSTALALKSYETVELRTVYRQSDSTFLDLLNRVRDNSADSTVLQTLNSRYIPDFNPPASEGYIRLTTHNRRAHEINENELAKLPTTPVTFTASIEGDFPEYSFPTDMQLTLKEGAQVMFLRNDPDKRYFNGMMGHIISISDNEIIVRPIDGTYNIELEPSTWENAKYSLDDESGEIKEEIQGTFTQYPLRLAWAITIHKSQGLTFEKAIIDAAASFAHGQTYVALSRCKTLEGMVLERPLNTSAIITDSNVTSFTTQHCGTTPTSEHISRLKQQYCTDCLDELFGMTRLNRAFDKLHRIIDEHLHVSYPILCQQYSEITPLLHDTLSGVADNFARQYRSLISEQELLNQRIQKACEYFIEQLSPLTKLLKSTPTHTDNKAVTAKLQSAHAELFDSLIIKIRLMRYFISQPFNTQAYIKVKAQSLLALETGIDTQHPATKKSKRTDVNTTESDITNPELYQRLCQWRTAMASVQKRPAYTILSNRALIAIANSTPCTPAELLAIPGIGKAKLQHYGTDILNIITHTD